MPSTPVPVPATTSTPKTCSTNSKIQLLPTAKNKETSTSIEVYKISEAIQNTKPTSSMNRERRLEDGM